MDNHCPSDRANRMQRICESALANPAHYDLGWGHHTLSGISTDHYFTDEGLINPDANYLLDSLPSKLQEEVGAILSMEGLEFSTAVEIASLIFNRQKRIVRVLKMEWNKDSGTSFFKKSNRGGLRTEERVLIIAKNAIRGGRNLRPLFHMTRYCGAIPIAIGVILDRRIQKIDYCLGIPFVCAHRMEDLLTMGGHIPGEYGDQTPRKSVCALCKSGVGITNKGQEDILF